MINAGEILSKIVASIKIFFNPGYLRVSGKLYRRQEVPTSTCRGCDLRRVKPGTLLDCKYLDDCVGVERYYIFKEVK